MHCGLQARTAGMKGLTDSEHVHEASAEIWDECVLQASIDGFLMVDAMSLAALQVRSARMNMRHIFLSSVASRLATRA